MYTTFKNKFVIWQSRTFNFIEKFNCDPSLIKSNIENTFRQLITSQLRYYLEGESQKVKPHGPWIMKFDTAEYSFGNNCGSDNSTQITESIESEDWRLSRESSHNKI
jgi:hypothetical protein